MNSAVSLPWFTFRYRDDPLSRLRREAYALQSARHPISARRRVTKALSWPLKAARQAWRVSGLWAAEARALGAPPRFAQAIAIWRLNVRYNINFQVYYLHKLWRKRAGVSTSDWMDGWDTYLIYELFSARRGISTLNDKLAFDSFCRQHDLSRLPVIAVVTSAGDIDWQQEDRRLPPADLFVKPVGGALGRGTMVFTYEQDRQCWLDEGQALDQAELLESLRGRAHGAGLLVQQRARNHPQLADASPDALCTVRCVTYRFQNESARHFRSALRMARRGHIVDHSVHGAVYAAVDDEGFLRNVRDRHIDGSLERHPDTDAQIAGRQLPEYQAMKALAMRAHDALGNAGIICWDVGLLPEGPVLVEGNSKGNLGFTQAAMDEPLGKSEYVSIAVRLAAEAATDSDIAETPNPGAPDLSTSD